MKQQLKHLRSFLRETNFHRSFKLFFFLNKDNTGYEQIMPKNFKKHRMYNPSPIRTISQYLVKKQWHGKNSPRKTCSFQLHSEKIHWIRSEAIWQCHNTFLFQKLVLIFSQTMQVSWWYHSSFWVAIFISETSFNVFLRYCVAEEVSSAVLCYWNPCWALVFISEQLYLSSQTFIHPFTVHPLSKITSDHAKGTLWDSSICLPLWLQWAVITLRFPALKTIHASIVCFQIIAQFTQRLWITFFKDFFFLLK